MFDPYFIAGALARAGHDVRFATGPDLHERVREAGLIPCLADPPAEMRSHRPSATQGLPSFPLLSLVE